MFHNVSPREKETFLSRSVQIARTAFTSPLSVYKLKRYEVVQFVPLKRTKGRENCLIAQQIILSNSLLFSINVGVFGEDQFVASIP